MIVYAIAPLGCEVVTPNTQHIEPHRAHIAKERYIGRRKNAVVHICTIETRRHHAQAKLGIGCIVRTTYHTEVKTLMLLVLIGIIEVIKKTSHPRFLGFMDCICRKWLRGIAAQCQHRNKYCQDMLHKVDI